MSKQKINFNYFKPNLVSGQNSQPWDMRGLFDYLIGNRGTGDNRPFDAGFVLGDEIADLEWSSCTYDTKDDLYYMQVTKMRSKGIPSKKRLNQDKVPLELEDDEYLGEFNLLIFDPKCNILIVQTNGYGLTARQLEKSLTYIRLRYLEIVSNVDEDLVKLEIIADPNAFNKIQKDNIIRRIKLKGADYQQIANQNIGSNTLSTLIDAVGNFEGINFEINISMGKSDKNESLPIADIHDIARDIINLNDDGIDVSMEVASKRDEEDAIEYTNLIAPRISAHIIIEVENRATVGADFIFQEFKEQIYLANVTGNRNQVVMIVGVP